MRGWKNLQHITFGRAAIPTWIFLGLIGVVVSLLMLRALIPGSDAQQNGQAAGFHLPDRAAPAFQRTLESPSPQGEHNRDVILPDTSLQKNCTYTSHYWKEHPDSWLAHNIIIGRFSYLKSEALAFLEDESDDLSRRLMKQFLAAGLNSLNGADTSEVNSILVESSDWISANLLVAVLDEPAREQGFYLLSVLEDYNAGRIGPGACPGQAAGNSPTLSPTATPTSTLRPVFNRPAATSTSTRDLRRNAGDGSPDDSQTLPGATRTPTLPAETPLPTVPPSQPPTSTTAPLPASPPQPPSPTNAPPTSTPGLPEPVEPTSPPAATNTPPTRQPQPPSPTNAPPTSTPGLPEPVEPTSPPEPTREPIPTDTPTEPPPDPGPTEPPPDPEPTENSEPPPNPEPPREPKPTREPRPTREPGPPQEPRPPRP